MQTAFETEKEYGMRGDLPTVKLQKLVPELERLFGTSLEGFEILFENHANGGLSSFNALRVDVARQLVVLC